jgi:hypothetical protein
VQIRSMLDSALTAEKHHSIVIAAEGSKVNGTLICGPAATKRLDDSVRERGRQAHRRLILDTLAKYPVDLGHLHSLSFHRYVPPGDTPVLTTLHLSPEWYPPESKMNRTNFRMNCVSWSRHRNCPGSRRLLPPIINGVDVETCWMPPIARGPIYCWRARSSRMTRTLTTSKMKSHPGSLGSAGLSATWAFPENGVCFHRRNV